MLHLLAWIVLFFKDIWWHKQNQNMVDGCVNATNVLCDETASVDYDDEFINDSSINQKKNVVEKEIDEITTENYESSLNDILQETSWKAVDGSLQSCAKNNIELTEGYFIVSKSDDGSSNVTEIQEALITGKKVERVNSYVESFGNVDDGENLKKAYILKRNESAEDKIMHEKGQLEYCKKSKNQEDNINMDDFQSRYGNTRIKNEIEIFDDDVNSFQRNEMIVRREYNNINGKFIPEADFQCGDEKRKEIIFDEDADKANVECQSTKFTIMVSRNEMDHQPSGYVSYIDMMKSNDRRDISKINVKLKDPKLCRKQETSYVVESDGQMSSLQRNDSWDSLDVKEKQNYEKPDTTTFSNEKQFEKKSPDKLRFHGKGLATGYQYESPKADLQDFDIIMKKRKKHTDTIQNISDTFGHFGHRDNKIYGAPSDQRISERWRKVQEAVRNRTYLQFKT